MCNHSIQMHFHVFIGRKGNKFILIADPSELFPNHYLDQKNNNMLLWTVNELILRLREKPQPPLLSTNKSITYKNRWWFFGRGKWMNNGESLNSRLSLQCVTHKCLIITSCRVIFCARSTIMPLTAASERDANGRRSEERTLQLDTNLNYRFVR